MSARRSRTGAQARRSTRCWPPEPRGAGERLALRAIANRGADEQLLRVFGITGIRTAVITAGIGATVVLLFVVAVVIVDGTREEKIADGVRIGMLDAGGLDRDAAHALVQRRLAATVAQPLTAIHERRSFVLRPQEAAVRLDVDATVDAALRRGRAGDRPVQPRARWRRRGRHGDAAGRLRSTCFAVRATKLASSATPATPTSIGATASSCARAPRRGSPCDGRSSPQRLCARSSTRRRGSGRSTCRCASRSARTATCRTSRTSSSPSTETAAERYKIAEKDVDRTWHAPNKAWAGDLAGQTIPPGDPRNPLKARWMGFHDGQGIHGTDDVASLGSAASHGCIRMAVPDVKKLFREVEVGTPLFLQ